jgi:NAD(P)-dependent dehydrogenase (short-subunit alcohol dehydrogenase family)
MTSLVGKTALVTGAARGIGAAIAVQLAMKGASIFLTANGTEDHLQKVARDCSDANPSVQTKYGIFDFFREGDPEKMVEAALRAFGRVDILVNNAGIRISKPFGEFSGKDFDQVVGVNLKAPFLASQAVIPAMKANGGGRIIHIASQMGLVTDQDISLYGLTKAALIHLTKSMAFELAPHNIIVNAVSPGPIMTEFNEERTAKNPALKARRLSYIRAGRYGRPEEIAEVVAFLATTDATYLQGDNLVVDGGYVTH